MNSSMDSKFSATGEAILRYKNEILSNWEAEVRSTIYEAKNLTRPIIINTFPAILENLAETLSSKREMQIASMDNTLTHEHGGERARMTNFDLTALINELRIMRSVLIRTLREKEIYPDEKVLQLIHVFIDDAIQNSATAFSLVQAELREEIMAALTHDMRSPLTAATLAAEMIIKKSENEFINQQAKKIKFNNRRIDSMIQDLLNATLIKTGGKLSLDFEQIVVTNLIEELIDSLPVSQQPKVKFEKEKLLGVWDRDHIKRALENLIINAFKYGDSEKTISLTVKYNNERIIFEVHNFGVHIPKEEQEAIFQIFRRAENAKKNKKQGWGVGLPLVRAVAEAHGGSVSVISSLEHGTTFLIDVPQDAQMIIEK